MTINAKVTNTGSHKRLNIRKTIKTKCFNLLSPPEINTQCREIQALRRSLTEPRHPLQRPCDGGPGICMT